MVKVTIFKPYKNEYHPHTIKDPIYYKVNGESILVEHSTSKGNITLRTNLPYFIEDGEGVVSANPGVTVLS